MISIKVDLRDAQRALGIAAKQIPFASVLALTSLAKGVQAAEREETAKTFEHPTPFTQNAFAVKPATKSTQCAAVFAKDIQAAYLEPYVVGGERSLGRKKSMLVPVAARINQYGNLTKGQLARLKGKPNVFVGKITTKNGRTINGVWQRPTGSKPARRRGAVPASSGLRLLIAFADTTEAPKHLAFYERASAYVRRNAVRTFDAALTRALATARR